MSGPFAGVELPDNIGQSAEAQAPNTNLENSSTQVGDTQEAKSPEWNGSSEVNKPDGLTNKELVDLEKLERFRFDGRELTAKELKDSFMMRSDYTRKTKELAEARKYADNFETDLGAVLGNPQLFDKLKEIYPANYVKIAEKALKDSGQQTGQQQPSPSATPSLPKEMTDALQEIKDWKAQVKEQTTHAMHEQLNSHHARLEAKYPEADSRVVDVQLRDALEMGLKVTKENLGEVLEKAYKEHHDSRIARQNALKKNKVEEQVKVGEKSRDVGAGGGIVGQSAKKYKSIREIDRDLMGKFTR